MPEMIVSPLSSSRRHAEGRILFGEAVERLGHVVLRLGVPGVTDSEITGSGTCIEVMAMRGPCHR
jgi:hypothetical protein